MSSTPTLLEREAAPEQVTEPAPTEQPASIRRPTLAWIAVVVAFAAVAALGVALASGNDGQDVEIPAVAPSAEAIEKRAHLEGQQRTHGAPAVPAEGSVVGSADATERRAHLENQAVLYGGADDPAGQHEFVPGSRRMPNE